MTHRILPVLTLAAFAAISGAQVPTYTRAVPLPTELNSSVVPLNDSGSGTTSHAILALGQIFRLQENGDGSASFGSSITSTARLAATSVAARLDTTSPEFVATGQLQRVYTITPSGVAGLSSVPLGSIIPRSIGLGGGGSLVLAESQGGTGGLYTMGYPNVSTSAPTLVFDSTVSPTGGSTPTPFGGSLTVATGADGYLRLLDLGNSRLVRFDLSLLKSGDAGAYVDGFALDPSKTSVNSMTVDAKGNVYVGDGLGGGTVYSRLGVVKGSFSPGAIVNDPMAATRVTHPDMNAYDDGFLDVVDATGYRQYTINAVPEPASLAALGLGALAMLKRRRANR
ncbi:PEP-CTERM sorting domain-containing protein [bacterium]|nr:MAG: PEP-CTERM sorting domain-containing protein [bacterium]